VGRVFGAWIEERITKYRFQEGVDYHCLLSKSGKQTGRGGQNAKTYRLTLGAAETGRNYPDQALLVRFCLLTGCSTDWLFFGTVQPMMTTVLANRLRAKFPTLIAPGEMIGNGLLRVAPPARSSDPADYDDVLLRSFPPRSKPTN
jgi:hypothetical protein